MKPDGGPAFAQVMVPHPSGGLTCGWDGYAMGGMSLRDYFAAHAPDYVEDWFVHVPAPKDFPPMPDVDQLDETHRKVARDWMQDPCFDLPEEIVWFGVKVNAHLDAKTAWKLKDRVARLVQWRWAYADLMVAERVKE